MWFVTVVAGILTALLTTTVHGKSASETAAESAKGFRPSVAIRLVTAPSWNSRQSVAGESRGTFEMEGGIGTLATIGVGDKRSWHGEAELGIRNTSASDADGLVGSMRTLSLMGNGYYGFKIATKVDGYVGMGLGLASHREDRGSDLALGYQIMSGIGYKLTKDITAIIGLRYFGTQAASLGRIRMEYRRPEVDVGLSYEF